MDENKLIPLILLGIGGYLTWFAIHYWARGGWPTTPVKSVLQGKGVPSATPAATTATLTADIQAEETNVSGASQASDSGGSSSSASGPGAPVQGTYSLSQLQTLWTSNGGSSTTSFIAANVAMAESSGRADATSSNPDGGTNVGIFQLDTKGVGAGYTVAQLKDPNTNARITVMATANGTNWSQWADSVVKGGRYVGPTQATGVQLV